MLGDRDYDAFEKEEHEYLKEKIAFAFFGPQQDVCGYNKKQKEKAQVVYEKICEIYGNFILVKTVKCRICHCAVRNNRVYSMFHCTNYHPRFYL